MGFFSEIASEARNKGAAYNRVPVPVRQETVTPPPVRPVPAPTVTPSTAPISTPSPAPMIAPSPAPGPVSINVPSPASGPAAINAPSPAPVSSPAPTLDLSADADAADEAERKRNHEAAEAKRKAEWDARQAEKKAVRQEQLERIKTMSDAELLAASVERVAADTERLTRRNMKEAVAEHVQAKCREDAAFARRVMAPEKSMINCFKYINRRALEYAKAEMKDLGIEQTGTYGCDVPDDLCYAWALDYFIDPNAKEDKHDEEKFVPKPYVPAARKKGQSKDAKKKPEKKKPAEEKPKASAGSLEQMCLI